MCYGELLLNRNQYKKKPDSTKKKSFILSVISELFGSDAKSKQNELNKHKQEQQPETGSFLGGFVSDIIANVAEKLDAIRHFEWPTLPSFKSEPNLDKEASKNKPLLDVDTVIVVEENTAKPVKSEKTLTKIVSTSGDAQSKAFIFPLFNFSFKSLFKSKNKQKNKQVFKPNATLKIAAAPEAVAEVLVKQDLIYQARSRRARDKFADDALVTNEVVKHEVTSHLTDEYASARAVKSNLNKTVNHRLLDDVSNL